MSPQKKEEIKDVKQGIKAMIALLESNKKFIGKDMDQGGILGGPLAVIMQLNSLLQDTYNAAHNKSKEKVQGLGSRIREAGLYDKFNNFISNVHEDNVLMKNKNFIAQLDKVTAALKEGNFDKYAPASNHEATFTPRSNSISRERSSSPGLSSSDEGHEKMLHNNKTKRK